MMTPYDMSFEARMYVPERRADPELHIKETNTKERPPYSICL
eukprot:Gb_22932 [translate_table: standard]